MNSQCDASIIREGGLEYRENHPVGMARIFGSIVPMLIQPTVAIVIQTRKGTPIPCDPPRLPMTPNEKEQVRRELDRIRKNLPNSSRVLDRRAPTWDYNCHGMTFLARRAWLQDDAAIGFILDDDGYVEVQLQEVLPGDIVLYRAPDGWIEHTGVVAWVDRAESPVVPWIVSKWANFGEFLHRANNSPYKGFACYMRETPDEHPGTNH